MDETTELVHSMRTVVRAMACVTLDANLARLVTLSLGAALAFHAPATTSGRLQAQQAPELGTADSIAIQTLWSELDASWNARDAARFSQVYTADASLAFVDRGVTLEGRDGIHKHFVAQFGRQSPELRHSTQIRKLRPIASDAIAMDGQVTILSMPSAEAPETVLRRFAVTAVMVPESDHWRIRLLRAYLLPQTPAPSDR